MVDQSTNPGVESAATGGWASGSLAVILPVRGTSTLLEDQLAQMRAGARRPAPETWNLAGLRRSSSTAGNRLAQPNVVAWNPLVDERITSTQGNCAYLLMHDTTAAKAEKAQKASKADQGGAAGTDAAAEATAAGSAPSPRVNVQNLPMQVQDPAHEEWWRTAAIELFSFCTPHDESCAAQTFLVLHLVAKPRGLQSISEVVAYFSSTYGRKDQGRERWPDKSVRALLKSTGFATGTTWDRPFVLTHLVPDQDVPDAGAELSGADRHGWSAAQVWAWRLAGGANLTIDAEPGWAPEAPVRGGFWSGSTWCRIDSLGAAFIGTRGLGELPTRDRVEGQVWWKDADADARRRQYIEHVRLEAYVHRTAVDLTILSMRQNAFLAAHATSLSRVLSTSQLSSLGPGAVPRPVGDPTPETDEEREQALETLVDRVEAARTVVIDLEVSLIEFRNELWFTHVPGDAAVTATLETLHAVLGSNRLLEEIEDEQRDIVRILALASDAASARLAGEQERRRQLLERIIAFVAPLIAAPGVVLAFVQVYQGGQEQPPSYLLTASLTIAAVCLVSWAVLVAVLWGPSSWRGRAKSGSASPSGPPR